MDRSAAYAHGDRDANSHAILHDSGDVRLDESVVPVSFPAKRAFVARRLDVCFSVIRRKFGGVAPPFVPPKYPTEITKCFQ